MHIYTWVHFKNMQLYVWGQRIYDPDPFYIKAQGLGRGEILSRMHNGSPKWPKNMAEDDLMLSIP